MTAPARLLSVRLQGFKSFAERTLVTFGPGISAVVGPNGSGKSNLADALRWALGEQGRALRSRKAEDVIWAGSERRPAVGMADVQLTLDNADGLLPVEYGVVELGRRLYRSGENEYLLNRQRVRLRDLVDLLDAAHLAENAFLFIGQGMVDQALALRPEERRPLFEEVAGVRRHERRRRRAEEQLVESEGNLARVEDILAELRPQARRLAAQAEQQATRASAGDQLAEALLVAAHARWHEAAGRINEGAARLASARAAVDAALGELTAAESTAAAIAAALEERATAATELRRRADDARMALTAAQLRGGRLESEAAELARDRERLAEERAAAEADLAVQRRRLAEPIPARDPEAEAALSAAERSLTDALAELAALQAATRARDADLVALRRAAAVRAAEIETAERRLAEAERSAAVESARAAEGAARLGAARAAHETALADLETSKAAERTAAEAREVAEHRLEQRSAEARTAAERAAEAAATLAGLQAELAARSAAVADDPGNSVAASLRGRGGRRIDEDLAVEPGLRTAVDAALAGAARAYVTTRSGIADLAGRRGVVVIADGAADDRDQAGGAPAASSDSGSGDTSPASADGRAFLRRVTAAGGGLLADGLRRDRSGVVRRLLARAAWVPDLPAALALQPHLPAGWIVVPRDGGAVLGEVIVRLGRGDGLIEAGVELERVRSAVRAAESVSRTTSDAAADAAGAAAAARMELEAARAAEAAATGRRRAAEESERLAARGLEALVREASWHAAQAARLAADVERARAAIPALPATPATGAATAPDADALSTWEARAVELRTRRDRLLAVVADVDGARRDGERRRAASEASIALDEARMAAADLAAGRLAGREAALAAERAAHAAALADASVRDAEARAALEALLAADAADRARLGSAEGAAASVREALRAAEERSRAAERGDLEARLGRDALREQLLVELAGLGHLGLRHLEAVGGAHGSEDETAASPADGMPADVPGDSTIGVDELDDTDDSEALAAALDAAGEVWAMRTPTLEVPGPGRLGALRRRYHELGASNPFAVEEYAALRARLEDLERQHDDLRTAITRTRALIAELDGLIADQFRTTFRALETAFDGRFRQLFGGGFARLSLTDPGDLASTGVEIVARPPGKKAQALAMLSGGERALTAVALLFAMLEVRPVPFCVLDEVDAALDEANVGRFTDALRELAERTQFVVITHNRGTIEIADALYGVTVGDDPVSRVISLRLDEATELAERRRAPVAVGPDPAAGQA
ncbi:MAG TPA: chromosome segregation protein SMC [Candidatus Sulfomarinibacteraceae bacterium]|nr:chromosome segregation protein SMC [Candidatus Sulfomarinibacteraceae bacterium]